jgi:hypothetical protein
MRWGCKTFVRIMFKTGLVFLLLCSGVMVKDYISTQIKIRQENKEQNEKSYEELLKEYKSSTRGAIYKDTIKSDSLMKKYR